MTRSATHVAPRNLVVSGGNHKAEHNTSTVDQYVLWEIQNKSHIKYIYAYEID